MLPSPVFWPGEFHGLHSPWGQKESNMTEHLSLGSGGNTVMGKIQVPFKKVFCIGEKHVSMILIRKEDRIDPHSQLFRIWIL